MKRTYVFAKSMGVVRCMLAGGESVELPVFAGILKHPPASDLPSLLSRQSVAIKYTREALRIAPWPILREFPPDWLRKQLEAASLRPSRRKALEFMLGP